MHPRCAIRRALFHGSPNHRHILPADLPLAQVAEFRFQARPFHWVEFKDVSLKPAKQTANSVRPNHAVTLANGVSVEVLAVGRNPRGATEWWNPNGTRLDRVPVEAVASV